MSARFTLSERDGSTAVATLTGSPRSAGTNQHQGTMVARFVEGRGFAAAHYLSLCVALVVLLYLGRRQWFFYDEWEFLATRGLGGQPLRLFDPHNGHWSTIPILIFRGLYALFGLRTYLPYIALLIVLHLITAHLLWRALLRIGADRWVATGIVGVFLLLGAGFENLTSAFQIGFVIPTLCGAVLLLLADHSDARFGPRDVVVWVVAVVALMSSAVGIAMVALAAVAALMRRGWRGALITVSVPAVVYLVWLALAGHQDSSSQLTTTTVLTIPDFVWKGLTNTIDASTGLIGLGAAAIIGLIVWLVWNRVHASSLAPVVGSGAAAVAFFALAGVGRAFYGSDQATAPRYVYEATALLLPVIAVVVSAFARRAFVALVAILVLAAFALSHNLLLLVSQADALAGAKEQSKAQILAGASLITSGALVIGHHPDPRLAPDLTTEDLTIMIHDNALPGTTDVAEKNRLDAVLALQVELSGTPEVPTTPSVTVQAGLGGGLQATVDGCVLATSYGANHKALLHFADRSSVRLTSSSTEQINAYLMRPDGLSSDPRQLSVQANQSIYLNVVANPPVTLTLDVPSADLQICGATTS
jgi:hypothetical protein